MKGLSRTKPGATIVDRVIRAVDAFRRGLPVAIKAASGGTVLAFAVETLPAATWKALRKPRLVLTHERARTLKIRVYTPDVVAVVPRSDIAHAELVAIADPGDDLTYPIKGPFDALREALPNSYAESVKLAKLAGLLPAAIVARADIEAGATLSAGDILAYDDEIVRTLKLVARARVPLAGAENTELVSFRPEDGGPEHYAIVINAPPTSKPVLTRLHSECFTGDLLGSLKCDCGDQLRGAIAAIEKAGGGVLLYLAQEGRGIGLINKLRAYRLQDQGYDTIDANERVGFAPDERQYSIAARMLELLGYKKVRLMTNNPEKVAGLKAAGIPVVARVKHVFAENEHNRAYLHTKATKAGHLF